MTASIAESRPDSNPTTCLSIPGHRAAVAFIGAVAQRSASTNPTNPARDVRGEFRKARALRHQAGHRDADRRRGSDDGWILQSDGSYRPVIPSDLEHRDELARDVSEVVAKAIADKLGCDVSEVVADLRRAQRELLGMYRRPAPAMSERRCSPPPVRRNTRRAPRRTRSARTTRVTATADPDGPEPPGRRPPSSRWTGGASW